MQHRTLSALIISLACLGLTPLANAQAADPAVKKPSQVFVTTNQAAAMRSLKSLKRLPTWRLASKAVAVPPPMLPHQSL